MDMPIVAVSIHDRMEPCTELEGALTDLAVETHSGKTCSEARELIAQHQPILVFVDHPIWKESHAEIVKMEFAADKSFNIVVVGSLPDFEKYTLAIEHGAFNFIAPPFSHDALTMVVHAAAMDALDRRKSLTRVTVPEAAN
jgi:DNA-binding NtrC family response regulator